MMRRFFGCLPLLCLCTVIVSAYATQWSPQSFPNPVKNVQQCGRGGKPSWICDPDHVLSDYSQNVIEGTIHEIAAAQDPYRSALCPTSPSDAPGYQVGRLCYSQVTLFAFAIANLRRAFQVAVALVDRMKLEKGRTQAEQAEVFAKSLHNTWGVGDTTCNSGLVLFLSKDDRQVLQKLEKSLFSLANTASPFYSTGQIEQPATHSTKLLFLQMYLAADEQVLSKDRQLYVLDKLKQKLRKGDFDGGIESAIVDIGLGLSGADMPDDTDSSWDWGLGFIGLIFGGFLCSSCWWVLFMSAKTGATSVH